MTTERMTADTRDDLIRDIEEMMGTEGSRRTAERLYDAMPHGHDGRDCWVELPIGDRQFWAAVVAVEKEA